MAASARSRRACGGRNRGSGGASSRSHTSSSILHQGRGELQTVTAASLVRSHREAREDPYRLAVGQVGAEAMLRLYGEPEANRRAFDALARFLDVLDEAPTLAPARAALDPLGLAFQLKLLWLSGYLPHLTSCVECGAREALVRFLGACRRRRVPRPRDGRVCRSRPAASRAPSGSSRHRLRTLTRQGCRSAPGARRSPSSRRRTRSTAASGSARCRRETAARVRV